jgi:N-acetylgalactosamine-6-sulfatase
MAATCRASGGEPPPNILFVLADDLGWGDLGCYGNANIRTPNLDGLSRSGTLFTQFYVNGSVCSPTRAALLTGRYPARLRMHGHLADAPLNESRGMPNWLDPEVPTLAGLLKQAGYATAHFGKWHLGSGPGAPDPSAYGFHEHRTVNSTGPGWDDEREAGFRARSSRLIVDEAIRFVRAHRGKPFYVNIWSLVPHATLNPTEEQMKPYARFGPGVGLAHKGAAQIYYASVTDLDAQIGRLLRALDELGVAQNTIVLFSSDNGPEDIHIRNASHSGVGSAGPFRGRKRSLYEGGVRVPFLVRWPDRTPAGRVDDQSVVSGVDLLPTLARLAGVQPPADLPLDGEDVGDILRGHARDRRQPIFWEWRFRIIGDIFHRSPMLAVRDGDWKLLMNPDRGRIELYDIPRDPTQLNNVAAAHPDVVDRLSRELLDWRGTLPPGPVEPAAGKADYPWPRRPAAQ